MAKYDNSGIIAKNARKEKETHPDITGQATIEGVEFWVNGWQKQGPKGMLYSLSFRRKEAKEEPKSERITDDPAEDEIPF
jgi:hypothetical protein